MAYEPLELEILPPYIGSAVSPEVDVTETTDDITVTITDFRGEHSYTVDKTDAAIADAEAAAESARQAAQDVQSAVDAATSAATRADASADNADSAAGSANTAATAANQAAGDANTAAQSANSAASTANASAANADAKAELADTAASNADAKATLANDAAANADAKAALADDAATSASAAAAQASTSATAANTAAVAADAAREAIQGDLANKADIDGHYPKLIAGAADSITGSGDGVLESFLQRVSEHDGMARIESVKGRTVVWNQLFPGNRSYTQNAIIPLPNGVQIIAGHKYLMKQRINMTSQGAQLPMCAIMYHDTSDGINKSVIRNTIDGGTMFTSSISVAGDGTAATGVWFWVNLYGGTGSFSNIQLFDLTLMFGAGNEPATVEEFESMFPTDYYPYDAGSLLSVNVEGIESAGVTREIPAATYFPDGMRSAGSVYDELTASKAVTRIGVVDLGTLAYVYNRTGDGRSLFTTNSLRTFKNPPYNKAINALSTEYEAAPMSATFKSGQFGADSTGYRIVFCNNNYTDAATYKAAMSGVMLYYELATPTETAIEPHLNLTYQTETGGIESIIIPEGSQSAPPTLQVVYGYTAEGLRDASQAIIATVEGTTASANYAIGGYFVHAGTLYRATSAIATGETINPGTNCVATTVMAEIVRLTA